LRFKHWLSKYPFKDRISDERMPILLAAVRSGQPTAIKEMIEGHLRLGMALVARFALCDEVVDDLVSASFLSITKAVNRIARGYLTHDNPTAYIVTHVLGGLRKELAKRPTIYTPELGEKAPKTVPLDHPQANISIPPDYSMEIEEELRLICDDDTDIKIIELLMCGFRGASLAAEVGMYKGNVSRRIQRIRQAYLERQSESAT